MVFFIYGLYSLILVPNKNEIHNLLPARGKKRKKDETTCPVCDIKLSGTPEELNEHVDLCLKKVMYFCIHVVGCL